MSDKGDVANWICGLMRHNTNELGFIPAPTVEYRYVRMSRYILQVDERGRAVGYLLHGAIQTGKPCVVSQHCIELDKRARGYGQATVRTLIERCDRVGASSIHLRCAVDLPAVQFWQSCGFRVRNIVKGGSGRNRMIAEMDMPLELPLFSYLNVEQGSMEF